MSSRSPRSTLHCLASEPNETFLRVVALDGKEAVAYETAVLGRLRRGYRVFQLRCELGTRIEQCYLLVKISFGSEPNRWPAPSHIKRTSVLHEREIVQLRKRNEAQARKIKELQGEAIESRETLGAEGNQRAIQAAASAEIDPTETHKAANMETASGHSDPPSSSMTSSPRPRVKWLARKVEDDYRI